MGGYESMKLNVLRFPGLGDRIRGRMRALGYWRPDNKPDVLRFADEKGYMRNYIYGWLAGRTPTYGYLLKLAKDLQVSLADLCFGEESRSSGHPYTLSPRRSKGTPIRRTSRGRKEGLCQVILARLPAAA